MSGSVRVIRDKEFAKRLEMALENHHIAPSGHGRQKWLRERILEDHHLKLSPEAVRKWFAGEARPRPNVMSFVARALEVDEAWLSLGITPAETPREKRKQNAVAAGAVNLVAAQIQLAGGNIAFPEDENEPYDLFAIVKGKQHAVTVRFGEKKSGFKLSVVSHAKTVIAVVPTDAPTIYEFVRLPESVIEQHGIERGGYRNIDVKRTADGLTVGGEVLPIITNFIDLK